MLPAKKLHHELKEPLYVGSRSVSNKSISGGPQNTKAATRGGVCVRFANSSCAALSDNSADNVLPAGCPRIDKSEYCPDGCHIRLINVPLAHYSCIGAINPYFPGSISHPSEFAALGSSPTRGAPVICDGICEGSVFDLMYQAIFSEPSC